MYCYTLCATPCALKLNGNYLGRATENYSILDISDGLLEFIPLNPSYAPVTYLVENNCSSNQNMKIIDLYGGILLIPVFNRRLFSDFKLIGRREFSFSCGNVYATCYAENGIRLIVENSSDMHVESLPFLPENIFFERAGRNGCEYLIVFLTGKRTLVIGFKIDKKITLAFKNAGDTYKFSNNRLSLTETHRDVLSHVITTDWLFDDEVKAVNREITRRKRIYALPEKLLSFAFFEEIIIGGDVGDFLTTRLRPRAEELKGFLGEYTAVLPPPHFKPQNLVTLLYKDKVEYAEIEFSGGLADNVSIAD